MAQPLAEQLVVLTEHVILAALICGLAQLDQQSPDGKLQQRLVIGQGMRAHHPKVFRLLAHEIEPEGEEVGPVVVAEPRLQVKHTRERHIAWREPDPVGDLACRNGTANGAVGRNRPQCSGRAVRVRHQQPWMIHGGIAEIGDVAGIGEGEAVTRQTKDPTQPLQPADAILPFKMQGQGQDGNGVGSRFAQPDQRGVDLLQRGQRSRWVGSDVYGGRERRLGRSLHVGEGRRQACCPGAVGDGDRDRPRRRCPRRFAGERRPVDHLH